MKNLYILPTDKPSRLVYDTNDDLTLTSIKMVQEFSNKKVHIYITSDEEIKEGFVLHLYTNRILEVGVITESNGNKSFREKNYHINGIEVLICDCKKITLTTDQDLINDGVQAIDDEFLQWFVKNPSCEWVEVGYGVIRLTENDNKGYWISIPNAEFNMSIEEPKQETLEKAAEKYSEKTASIKILVNDMQDRLVLCESAFEAGAKWQQEQNRNLYSEEDVRKMFSRYNEIISHRDVEEWQPWIDKQFKKK